MNNYIMEKYPAYTFLKEGNAVPLIRGLRVIDMEGAFKRQRGLGESPGFVEFFGRKTRKFPTGLMNLALKSIKEFNPDSEVEIIDCIDNAKPLQHVDADILEGVTLRPYQIDSVNKCLDTHRGVFYVGTGGGKTLILLAMIAELLSKGYTSLIMVPTTAILMKTANQIEKYLDVKPGICGGKYRTVRDVTVITNQSLDAAVRPDSYEIDSPMGRAVTENNRDTELLNFINNVDALFIDEVHTSTAPAWYRAAMSSNAWFRVGFTGTLDEESEIRMMRLMATTGSILIRKPAHELIEEGYLAVPYIHAILDESLYGGYEMPNFVLCRDATEFYRKLYTAAIVENDAYNGHVADLVKELSDRGKAVLVVCQMRQHFRVLQNLLENRDVQFWSCWGDTPLAARVEAMNELERTGQGVILATKIFDVGVDIPALDAIVLTAGGKASISTRQRAGRGLRAKIGKENVVRIFDFMNNSVKKLAQHSLARWEIYENEQFEVVPEDNFQGLLKKIRNGEI